MRGLPRRVDRVAVFHATRLDSAALRAQMSSMSTAYGVKAVGKAAAATVLLPLAIGVDLIILPGPQVLTYYTSWQLWRNATGAAGAWQRAAFVTQSGDGGGGGGSGGGGGVRVEFVPDPRLDRAHDATGASRDGVLPEEEISALVAALREPSLEEPLRELRRQRLRKGGRAAADGAGRYAPLPTAGGGGGGGGAALDDDDDDDEVDAPMPKWERRGMALAEKGVMLPTWRSLVGAIPPMEDVPGLEKGARSGLEGAFKMMRAALKDDDVHNMIAEGVAEALHPPGRDEDEYDY